MRILSSALLFLLVISTPILSSAQDLKFVDAKEFRLYGQDPDVHDSYQRFANKHLEQIPTQVRDLSFNTAGLYLDFKTNSKSIALHWVVDQYRILKNMTPIAINGFDLYGLKGGKWQFVGVARPNKKESRSTIVANLDGSFKNYRLYFPLYTGVESLKIGVDSASIIQEADPGLVPNKKVLIYGSSITQGASASRPGMAFPSILSRMLDIEFLNFGFSGSGKIELEVAQALSGIQTDLIILDCVPNPTPEQIAARTIPFIEKLREAQPNTPILMVESVFRGDAQWDERLQRIVAAQNQAFWNSYLSLKEEGMDRIYYVRNDGHIKEDHEGTIDGSHLTDLGHLRMARKLAPLISEILKD